VRALAPSDWPAMLELDAAAFGASRASVLHRLADEAPEYARVAEQRGRLRGYALGRHGHVREQLGPIVALDGRTAEALLDACLAGHSERSFFIDVPETRQAFAAQLALRGFAIQRTFLRMRLERLVERTDAESVYAIVGPEFG
jgi:hypothetical protein